MKAQSMIDSYIQYAAIIDEISKPIDLNKKIPQVSKGVTISPSRYLKRNNKRRIANKSKSKNRKK